MRYAEWATKVYRKVQKDRDLLLSGPAQWLIRHKITANQLSFGRLALIVPMFWAVGTWPWLVVGILIINYYVLDALDGVVARKSGKASIRGRAIDVSIDHFYVVPLVLALIYFNKIDPFIGAVYITVQLIDNFVQYLRFGIEAGKYPFSYGKFVVYFAVLLWAMLAFNLFDYLLLALSAYLAVKIFFSIYLLFHGK